MSDPDCGRYNAAFDHSRAKVITSGTYKDLSTAVLIVSRGSIPTRVYQALTTVLWPPNQRRTQIIVERGEVGDAYNEGVQAVLAACRDWKFLMTFEEDNLPPPDAVLKLYEAIEEHGLDIVGGLYWLKNEMGIPCAFGDARGPWNLRPIVPEIDTVQRVHMVGLGCTLWRLDVFRQVPQPWFKTQCEPGTVTTQDVPFFERACRLGIKTAVHTGVRVGHMDVQTGVVW